MRSQFTKTLRSYRGLFSQAPELSFKAHIDPSEEHVYEAQILHAQIYLEQNYILPADIAKDQRISHAVDPYKKHSTYFVITDHKQNGKVVATARQIREHNSRGHESFPTIAKLKLYDGYKNEIMKLDPAVCLEVSGLAKAKGVSSSAVLMLYRTMWHYSLKRGDHLWIMAVDLVVYRRLKFLFGDALIRIGPNDFYMGSEVVPAILEVNRSLVPLQRRRSKSINPLKRIFEHNLIQFMLDGAPERLRKVKNVPISAFEALKKDES